MVEAMGRKLDEIIKNTAKVMERNEAREKGLPSEKTLPGHQSSCDERPPKQVRPDLKVITLEKGKTQKRKGLKPMLEGGFTPFPAVIDDFARKCRELSEKKGGD